MTPYVYYAGVARESVVEQSREMAEQTDVPYMVRSCVAKGGCYNYAASLGIPSVLIERGQMGGWTLEESHSTRRDAVSYTHLDVYKRQVKGDAHDVMRQVLNGAFDGLFTIPEEPSGVDVGTYQFDRYTDALTGFTKMLLRRNARIHIEIKQGGSNEPFSVVLSAVPIRNLSSEIEYSQDSKIAINLKESRRGINHLICLGKGELKDRQVAHLYAQLDGSIRQDKKYYNGLLERTAVYDYSSAEGMEDLIENGTEKLQELMGKKTMGMSCLLYTSLLYRGGGSV